MGKLKKFEELKEFSNVFEKPESETVQGKWASDVFKNNQPIVLELACGKGAYTLALAERFPNKNFIGIDIKGHRLHVGARKALKDNMHNVHFLRIFIDHIDVYFLKNEVDAIWITFPDPYLKRRDASKRLTSPKFLRLYKKILSDSGRIHLKTDSPELFQFTLDTINEMKLPIYHKLDDVYQEADDFKLLTDIQTHYEKKHLRNGRTIRYVAFGLG